MSLRDASRIGLIVVIVLLAGCAGGLSGGDTGSTDNTSDPVESSGESVGSLEVHYINVGQSVSTLIISPDGETMLVDTGHYNDDGEHVLAYLRQHEIDRIDHLVTSHGDADHIGGNAAIIEHYETEADGIGAVYDPGITASTNTYSEYLDAIEAHEVTLYETREGDTIDFDDVDVNVLGPPDPYLADEDRNENSIVLKLTHGTTSFVLTGDAEAEQEEYLVDEYGDELQATVLKAGHHGSSSSTSDALLDAAQPQAVVISSAYDSQYGHPHDEVLARLSERSIPTMWTATHGDTVFVSDGTNVSIQTQQDAPTDSSELRDGEPIEPATGPDPVERTRITGSDEVVSIDQDAEEDDSGDDDSTADGELSIAEINADAEGDDRENLNDEYVVFENMGSEPLDLSGWTVEDAAGRSYTFPAGVEVEPNATITLRTGSGTDTETELFWGSGSPVWNNDGDTVIVRDDDGAVVLEETY